MNWYVMKVKVIVRQLVRLKLNRRLKMQCNIICNSVRGPVNNLYLLPLSQCTVSIHVFSSGLAVNSVSAQEFPYTQILLKVPYKGILYKGKLMGITKSCLRHIVSGGNTHAQQSSVYCLGSVWVGLFWLRNIMKKMNTLDWVGFKANAWILRKKAEYKTNV